MYVLQNNLYSNKILRIKKFALSVKRLFCLSLQILTAAVNIYKPPPTRLQVSDFPVFPHPCLYAGDFDCPHVDWGYYNSSVDAECLLAWENSDNLSLLHNPKDEPSVHSESWNTGTNMDLAFTNVGPDSRLPHRRVLEKFPTVTTPTLAYYAT